MKLIEPEKSQAAWWDALAPHLAHIEDNYMDRSSVRRIMPEVRGPVLVVGAGQGLLVRELLDKGLHCDGVDFSSEMVRWAELRRGIKLVEADARRMPFAEQAYQTVIYATGVVDFAADEGTIREILVEGRRVLQPGGTMFIAFYRISPALQRLLTRLGLLRDGLIANRESLQTYLFGTGEMVRWVSSRVGISRLEAFTLLVRGFLLSSRKEKALTLNMRRMFGKIADLRRTIEMAAETVPYRDSAEIRLLFKNLGVSIASFRALESCFIVSTQG